MWKLLIIGLFLFFITTAATAATDTPAQKPLHVRISVITVGPGPLVYEALGHVCIRVIDSSRTGEYGDIVFNYGTFDNFEEQFAKKMIQGTLNYYLSIFNYNFFINSFVEKGRSLEEQVLLLSDADKLALLMNLERNSQPANKYYKYNFFVDNCSTRIYYMLANTFGRRFVPGQALPTGYPATYFQGCRDNYRYRHWERVGINIFFESRMNMAIDNESAMFLPAYLSNGLATATLDGRRLFADKNVLAADTLPHPHTPNQPFILACILAIATIAGLMVPQLRPLGRFMSSLLLYGTGILGCLILYAWLGTDHAGTENNYNLLWALPSNLIVALLGLKAKSRYALAAIVLIVVTLILYMAGVLILPLLELAPIFVALIFVYGHMYRTNRVGK
jgi:hypothetical protein